jgi:hypothetical protein
MRFGIPSLAFVLASGCGADTELVRSDATADASSDDATVPPPGDDNLGDDAGLAPPVDAMPADVRVAQDGEPNGVLRSGLVLDASVTLADCPDATPIPMPRCSSAIRSHPARSAAPRLPSLTPRSIRWFA